MALGRSFRTRILAVILATAVVPLVLVGLWLTDSARRSGESLLYTRLAEANRTRAERLVARWTRLRSRALFIVEDPDVQRSLLQPEPGSLEPPPEVTLRFATVDPALESASLRDPDGRALWTLRRPEQGAFGGGDGMPFPIPAYERVSGRRIGSLHLVIDVEALLTETAAVPGAAGMVLAAVGAETRFSYLPTPFDPLMLEQERFTWGGAEWVAVRRTLGEPPLTLISAAPVSDFLAPFESAARRGTWILVLVAIGAVGLAVVLTNRMTRSLRRLSDAAGAVAAGDLERRVAPGGDDEVGRVASAFNTMTENLRRTLRELANRESFAAVGEFAATLAHEVRNPLTAIRVNLQYAEEGLPERSTHREAQERALFELQRLDDTVTRALKVARSGHIESMPIDLRAPLLAAADAARPSFARRGATLGVPDMPHPIALCGDAGAIEQLFLNLLRNAAQALDSDGRAEVAIETAGEDVVVEIRDDGIGIPESMRSRVFEPLFTTRTDGTGLGLPIARRIAVAHGGGIELEDRVEGGTIVRVRLPLAGGLESGDCTSDRGAETVTVRRPIVTDHYEIRVTDALR